MKYHIVFMFPAFIIGMICLLMVFINGQIELAGISHQLRVLSILFFFVGFAGILMSFDTKDEFFDKPKKGE